jgi:hypothetical protein
VNEEENIKLKQLLIELTDAIREHVINPYPLRMYPSMKPVYDLEKRAREAAE